MKKAILTNLLLCTALLSHEDYELGSGLQVAELPLYVGGYISLDYQQTKSENHYRLDDIAFLSYGNFNKFSYMAELEFKDFYHYTTSDDKVKIKRDQHLYAERVYANYQIDDTQYLQVGKYYAPIGFWNLLPINVLRDTTSNPITNEILYPKYITGVGYNYTTFTKGIIDFNLLLQNNKSIDNDYNNYHIDKYYSLGASYENNLLTLKIDLGYFHQSGTIKDNNSYLLLSSKYENDDYKIMSEIGSQYSELMKDYSYAAYLQGLYNFSEKHTGITRFEFNQNSQELKNDKSAILAYTYRPIYPAALKSEYQFHTNHNENRFVFSLSVLF